MPKYIFDGATFTTEQLTAVAEDAGITLDELFEKNPTITQVNDEETTDIVKETPSQETESAAVEENVALDPTPVTEFKPVDISLGLPEVKTGTVADTEYIIPAVTAKESQKIIDDFNKASNVNVEFENKKATAEKISRFKKGQFKIAEKEEYNLYKETGEIQPVVLEQSDTDQKIANNRRDFMEDIAQDKRVQLLNQETEIRDSLINTTNKLTSQIKDNVTAVNNIIFQYDESAKEDVPFSADEYNIARKKAEEIIKSTKQMESDLLRDFAILNKKNEFIDSFKRSYSNIDQLENVLKTSATDMALGLAIPLDMLKSEEGKEKSYAKDLLNYRQKLQKESAEGLPKAIPVESISSLKDLVNWGSDSFVNFVPSGVMAFTGPIAPYIFELSGFGSRMAQFELEALEAKNQIPKLQDLYSKSNDPLEKAEIQKQIDKYNEALNVSNLKKLAVSGIYGKAERYTEMLTTVKLVKDLKSANTLFYKEGFAQAFKQAIKDIPLGGALEGGGEGLNSVIGNVADITILGEDKSAFEGVTEATAQGFFIGNGFKVASAGSLARAYAYDVITDKQNKQEIENTLKEINNLSNAFTEDTDINTKAEAARVIRSKIKEIGLNQDFTASQFLKLSEADQQAVFEADRQSKKVNERWKKIANSNLDETSKGLIRKDLEAEFNSYQDKKISLLRKSNINTELQQPKGLEAGDFARGYKRHQVNDAAVKRNNSLNKFANKVVNVLSVEAETINDFINSDKTLLTLNDGSVVTKEEAQTISNIWENGADGGFDSGSKNQYTIIERAAANNPSTVLHEYFHAMSAAKGFTEEQFNKIKDDYEKLLKIKKESGELTEAQYNSIVKRLPIYDGKPEQAEELINITADAVNEQIIKETDFNFLQQFANNVKSIVGSIIGKDEANNFNINTAEDAWNMVQTFSKDVLSSAPQKLIIGTQPEEDDQQVKETETIIKESRSEDASNKVQELYEQKGVNAAVEIIEQFKPITNKIVEQRKNAPGFDKQLLTDEIETGAGGILDLIKAYDPTSNVPLAAYINKYLPVRSITASRRILGEEFTDDITESPSVAAEAASEVEVEVAEKAPAKKLKEVKETLSKENQTELKDVIAKLNLTEDQLTFKALPNAAIEIFAKQIGIPAKKFDGKANFTRNELDKVINFIEENVSTIRQALPEAAVAEGSPVSENLIGTATGVPNNLLKDSNLYTRQDRGTRLSGLIPYVKNKGIDNNSILKAIGNADGRRMASPRDKQAQTAKGLINMLAKFATNQEVRKQKTLTPKQRSNVEVGKGSKLLYSFTTKGDGTWVPDLRNPLSGDKFYNFNVADTWFRISSFKNSGFNYDILEETFGIKEGAFANDINSKSIAFYDLDEDTTEITGKMGTKDSIKVFSIVANSIIDLIKKDNLNSVTFTAKEPSRQKLYEAMVQKFQKELGWESYDLDFNTPEGVDAAFVVYDPKFFINEETAVTTEKESGVLYSKNIDQKTVDNISTIINNFKTSNDYTNLNNEVLEEIRNELAISEIKTLGDVFDIIKNIAGKTLSTIKSKREFEAAILNSLINITEDSNTKNELLEAFKTYRKLFKYEQNVIGYNYSLEKLKNNFKGTNTEKIETVKKYLKFISRSVRTLGIDGLKTNELLFKKLDNELGKGKLKKLGFGIEKVTDKKNKTRSYITLKKNRLAGLQDITEIKRNPKEFSGIVKTESEEVLDYYIELIKEAKTATELEQIKSLIALTSADQRGMLRKLSTLGFAIKPFKGEKLILEHQTTALELFTKIIDFIDGNIKETELRSFVNQAKINLVPESFAILLDSEKTQNGNARYETEKAKTKLEKYKKEGRVIDLSIKSKSLMPLANSKSKAAVNNNNKLSKSQRINEPKSWWKSDMVNSGPSKMVLDRMKSLDNQANEERIKYSKSQDLDDDFNKIIEAKTGIKTYQRFDQAGATVRGASKGKFNFFIPPSAEDFVGLLYKTLGKGKVGDSQMQFYKDNLLDPYGRAMNDVSSARVAMFEDYKTLKEDLNIIPKDLSKKGVEEYTREQAVRVYIWDQQENKIPGIFKTNQQKLVDYVNANPDLKQFGDQLIAMQKGDGYVTPKEGWLAGTITTDLLDSVNSIKRKKYLEQWQTNVDEMFGESNMNKLEAAFGKPYRRALEDALSRMKSGRNKKFTAGNEQVNAWTNWVNNSVGTIMFLNSRSAILQTLSTVNFLNFEDNNVFKAGAAFANQPQYWKDFMFLFNSDFLKERRGGLRFNVNESEIADAAKRGGARGVVSKILQAGFLPTQMADSFAIAAGGATFYRNRLNTYLKETDADGNKIYTEAEAQEKTFLDFRETAEESQQSSRPDRISMEQAGPLGRTILAFANTPAQYTRIMKKAVSDIKNGRGSLKANVSRLIYYGVVQNVIFGAIQAATFSLAFGGGDEEDQLFEEKAMRIANGTADSILRGAGLYGAIAATIKNTAIKLIKESKKPRTDYFEAGLVELAGISPPIQTKVKKWRSATKSYEYNKKEMIAKGFSLDSPSYLAGANVIAAFTNLPTDRVVKKVTNVYDAMQEDVEVWKRTALLMGWSKWELEPTVRKTKTIQSSRRGSSRSTSRSSSRSSNKR